MLHSLNLNYVTEIWLKTEPIRYSLYCSERGSQLFHQYTAFKYINYRSKYDHVFADLSYVHSEDAILILFIFKCMPYIEKKWLMSSLRFSEF